MGGLIQEFIIVLPHPNYFTIKKYFTYTYHDVDGKYITAKLRINDILMFFVILRLYYVIRYALSLSIFKTVRATRVTQMFGEKTTYVFAFKSIFNDFPFPFLILVFPMVVCMYSFFFRIFERPFFTEGRVETSFPEMSYFNYENFFNSVWTVFITMMTVGYGDFFAKSIFTRLITFTCIIAGILFTGMITVAFFKQLDLSTNETKAFILLERLKLRENLVSTAEKLVSCLTLKYFYKSKITKLTNELNELLAPKPVLTKKKKKKKVVEEVEKKDIPAEKKRIEKEIQTSYQKLKKNNLSIFHLNRQKIDLKKKIDNIDCTQYTLASILDSFEDIYIDLNTMKDKTFLLLDSINEIQDLEDKLINNTRV